MIDTQTVVTDILSGNISTEDINRISRAIQGRREMDKHRTIALNKANFDEGDKVILTGLRPKYLNGHIVTILNIRNVKAEVQMPMNANKYSNRKVIVPLNCLKKA
jgi:hypothetical protein